MKRKLLIGIIGVLAFSLSMLNFSIDDNEKIISSEKSVTQGFGDCWQTVACTGGSGYCDFGYEYGKKWINLQVNMCRLQ